MRLFISQKNAKMFLYSPWKKKEKIGKARHVGGISLNINMKRFTKDLHCASYKIFFVQFDRISQHTLFYILPLPVSCVRKIVFSKKKKKKEPQKIAAQ